MSDKEQKHIYLAGLLHDIGKLGIPDSCLFKPGNLTGEEWREIKKHPVFSYEILSVIPEMENISVMALYHHKRYDGKGYPEGLRGEAIPLGARFFKWVKQHFRVKRFYGTSQQAVENQLFIALVTYCLLMLLKLKRGVKDLCWKLKDCWTPAFLSHLLYSSKNFIANRNAAQKDGEK